MASAALASGVRRRQITGRFAHDARAAVACFFSSLLFVFAWRLRIKRSSSRRLDKHQNVAATGAGGGVGAYVRGTAPSTSNDKRRQRLLGCGNNA